MASELTKTAAALVGVLLVGAGVAVAWSIVEPIQVDEEVPLEPSFSGTRVFFVTTETRFTTQEHDLPGQGSVDFRPIDVPLVNVTRVTVTLHTQVQSPSVNDQYTVQVRTPDEGQEEGVWSGPLISLSGYRSSYEIIPNWMRSPLPHEVVYPTTENEEALRWSAQNHTYTGSVGLWDSQLEIDLPGPLRTGNVSLSFTFTHYEAVAVLEPVSGGEVIECPDPQELCPVENATVDDPARATTALTGPERQDSPNNFITRSGVARSIDRDPGPHGPI